jgi:hypothetical protein
MKVFRAGAVILSAGVLSAGCAQPSAEDESSCVTSGVPKAAQERYSIGEPPSLSNFTFCEGEDRDGSLANFTFTAEPHKSKVYLKTLGMDWEGFTPASPEKIEELSHPKRMGWKLKAGTSYLVNRYSREWNGKCLADYVAYVPAGSSWNGEVFIGVYCQD